MNPAQKVIQLVKSILFSPREFFKTTFYELSFSNAVALGLLSHWLGQWILHFSSQFIGLGAFSLDSLLQTLGTDERVDSFGREAWFQEASGWFHTWMNSVMAVILDPFYTLGSTFLSCIFIFVAASLFIRPRRQEVTFGWIFKILAVSLVPYLFVGVPILGSLGAPLWSLILVVLGVEQTLGASRGVAIVVATFPKLLLLFLIASLGILLVGGLLALFIS